LSTRFFSTGYRVNGGHERNKICTKVAYEMRMMPEHHIHAQCRESARYHSRWWQIIVAT